MDASNDPYRRQLYIAKNAQAAYENLLVEARTGIPLNREEFYETERMISAAVRNEQHIYHAIKANHLPVSVATVAVTLRIYESFFSKPLDKTGKCGIIVK